MMQISFTSYTLGVNFLDNLSVLFSAIKHIFRPGSVF